MNANNTIDEYGCVCGDCIACRPDLFAIKPNQCVVCGCYNLSAFKKVENKHIHCLDCYKQVTNAKRREQRKQKKDLPKCECCGKRDESVGLATGENGVEMTVCRFCDVDGSNYNGWGDKEEDSEEGSTTNEEDDDVCPCGNCDVPLDEDMHIFCFSRGDEEMTLCKDCGEDCYDELKADGWVRDDEEEEEEDEEVCNDCGCDLTDKHYNEVYGNMVCDDCNKEKTVPKVGKLLATRPCREGCGAMVLTKDIVALCDMCRESKEEEKRKTCPGCGEIGDYDMGCVCDNCKYKTDDDSDDDEDSDEDSEEEEECTHKYECGCDKEYCEDCVILDRYERSMCDDEACKQYYKYRNDNCNCDGLDCGFCNPKEEDSDEDSEDEEDYESADCAKCCENFLLDKMEKVNDELFCRDCIEPCKCTDAMDIRGRCQIDKAGFTKCPAFADTACFYICNDSDLDMKIKASEDLGINCTPIIIQWLSDYNVPADLHESILNLYNEWRVDEYDSPNVSPYKKCSECGERKSCGSYCDTTWFCENCAEEEEEEDCRTKPCSCGCGYLGGSCDRGLAIDNGEDEEEVMSEGLWQKCQILKYIKFNGMPMEDLYILLKALEVTEVSGWTREQVIAKLEYFKNRVV